MNKYIASKALPLLTVHDMQNSQKTRCIYQIPIQKMDLDVTFGCFPNIIRFIPMKIIYVRQLVEEQ